VVVSFIGGGNPSTMRKPPILSQVTDKLYHIMLFRVCLAYAGFELTTLVVIGNDCTGSCKSNYHTITARTAPTFRWDDDVCFVLDQYADIILILMQMTAKIVNETKYDTRSRLSVCDVRVALGKGSLIRVYWYERLTSAVVLHVQSLA